MEKPLVSIIIPTYNRANLIGETLDSVIAQTYTNWECIVVDDGSKDNTDEVMASYVAKDSRFRYFHRPDAHKPGGSGARNYGFLQSKGKYINWFDSDDLMVPSFIMRKVETLEKHKVDFVVCRGDDFQNGINMPILKYEGNYKNKLTGKNFILGKNYWITNAFMGLRKTLINCMFNEELKSGQETNFFTVLLNKEKLEGIALNEVLFLRRIHPASIQQKLKTSDSNAYRGKLLSLLASYYDVKNEIDVETRNFMQKEIMTTFYLHNTAKKNNKEYWKFVRNLFGHRKFTKIIAFVVSIQLSNFSNKGYSLFTYSRS